MREQLFNVTAYQAIEMHNLLFSNELDIRCVSIAGLCKIEVDKTQLCMVSVLTMRWIVVEKMNE